MDNKNEVKETKKKGKAGKVFKNLLLVFVGVIIGNISMIIFIVLACIILFGAKDNYITKVISKSKVLDKTSAWKIEELEKLTEVMYYEDVDMDDLREGMYSGLMSGVGDVYTCYYTPEEYKKMREDWNGNYEGIGAYLKADQDAGYAQISGFIKGGSAIECGQISEGDYIEKVNGEDMYGLSLDDVVSKVRGEEGTTVTITFVGEKGEYEVTLERRKIDTPTVEYEEKEDGIWYIQITEFDSITKSQFEEALQAAKDGGMKALIIDLRGNPGGNLDTVVDICRDILPAGMIVYTEDKNGNREEFKCDGKNELQVPLAVLVNGNSASASEIMAGAIKDHKKGTLIGTKTYGKGIVQSIIPLQDGSAVKITTSKYYTPNGNNIHKIGIEPDEEVKFDSEKYLEDETDNQLDYAIDFLKGQMK